MQTRCQTLFDAVENYAEILAVCFVEIHLFIFMNCDFFFFFAQLLKYFWQKKKKEFL